MCSLAAGRRKAASMKLMLTFNCNIIKRCERFATRLCFNSHRFRAIWRICGTMARQAPANRFVSRRVIPLTTTSHPPQLFSTHQVRPLPPHPPRRAHGRIHPQQLSSFKNAVKFPDCFIIRLIRIIFTFVIYKPLSTSTAFGWRECPAGIPEVRMKCKRMT